MLILRSTIDIKTMKKLLITAFIGLALSACSDSKKRGKRPAATIY